MYYVFVGVVVVSGVFYHISQKEVPKSVNPMASLAFSYIIALIGSIILLPVVSRLSEASKSLNLDKLTQAVNWPSFFVGVTIIGIEIGVMMAYRYGGKMNNTSLIIYSTIAAVLFLVGVYHYNETISWQKLFGAVLCFVGLVVMALSK
ncbi:MAG: hypothetical protein WCO55_03965 [Candidatus Falkowbacteria bacterium]